MIEGIQFVVNQRGEKTAVQIDLQRYGEIWEDIYDTLVAQERADEPRESLESASPLQKSLITSYSDSNCSRN
jgi:hypothetical protein